MTSLHIEDLSNDPQRWSDTLNDFPLAGVGHLHEWGRIISRSYGWKSLYLSAVNGSEIRGLLPLTFLKSKLFGRVLVSMPYLNDGGILSKDPETEKFLWSEALAMMKNESMSRIELRHTKNMKLGIIPRTDKISMITDLSGGEDNVWMGKLHSNVRNKVRKSKKMGVEIKEGPEWLKAFYNMHVMNMQELGSPAHSLRFFKEIISILKDRIRLYIALLEDEVIGGKIVCYFKDAVYFLWVSSPIRYRKYAAVSLMDWHAIEDAIKRGLNYCDFGRSTIDSTHYQFKKKWGAEVRQLYWQVYPQNNGDNDKLRSETDKLNRLSRIWKKLPHTLARIIGPWLRGGLPQ
ncbi:GNAT family N-acetyltransferase [Thermodesulfobacteriota bacterium]